MFEQVTFEKWIYYMEKLIIPSIWVTIKMLGQAMILSLIFGFLLATVLVWCNPDG